MTHQAQQEEESRLEGDLGFITERVVRLDLAATDKGGMIGELVDVLVEGGQLDAANRDQLVEAVLHREQLGSTGIGSGLAIPHAKASPLVEGIVGAFGRSSRGVEFGASDGEHCDLFFLMISPEDGVHAHLRILRKIAQLGRNEHFLRFLREATSKADVVSILQEVGDG